MKILNRIMTAVSLLAVSGAATAVPVVLDFKAMAEPAGLLGESAWSTLMFKSSGAHTTNAADAFLSITGTNGNPSYAYLDANNAGLGVCGALLSGVPVNTATNSGTNLCNPSSDDNISYHNGNPETLHFLFSGNAVIEKVWLNNNHDGDRSLQGDFVDIGLSGSTSPVLMGAPDSTGDSMIVLNQSISAGQVFDIGFYANQSCGGSYNNCELYVSKIEFSTVPEPGLLALLGMGLLGMGAVRRCMK